MRTNHGVAPWWTWRPTLSVIVAIELEAASQRIAKQQVAQAEVRANPRRGKAATKNLC
jgi:hypothetical protein